jgi:cobalamin biosynthesis Mg chelatase CobN
MSLCSVPGHLHVSSLLFDVLFLLRLLYTDNSINSCYNNCPSDIRAPSVQQQVDSYCRTASLLATTTTAHKTKTSDSASSDETSGPEASAGNDEATQTGESSSKSANAARTTSSKAAAPTMIGSVAGIFMAVAGAAAAAII